MSQPLSWASHENQSSTGPGDSEQTRGHIAFGLYVLAENLDTTNDTIEVRLEGSDTDSHYSPLNRGAPAVDNAASVTTADFVQSTEDNTKYSAYVATNSYPIEWLRANITSFTDNADGDLSVTTKVYVGGWTGSGAHYNREI